MSSLSAEVEDDTPVVEEDAPRPAPEATRPATTTDRTGTPAPSQGAGRQQTSLIRVLYVCTANICRSPYMELVSRHRVGEDANVSFSSAGTHGFRGSAMDADMAATLTPRGIDGPGSFRSRAFATEMLMHADLVLTAETAHRQFILDDHPGAFRKVFTLGQFAEAVQGLDADLAGRPLLAAVAERRGAAEAALDVPDPYRQGPEAAEACAVAIDDLLAVVLPALTGARKADS